MKQIPQTRVNLLNKRKNCYSTFIYLPINVVPNPYDFQIPKKESHRDLDWRNDDRFFFVFKRTVSLIRLMILFWVCVECCIPASWMLFWASCQTKMLLTALLREVRQHWGWKRLGNVHHKIAWCTIIIYCNIQDLKRPLQPIKCSFGVREKILSSESCSMFLLNIQN